MQCVNGSASWTSWTNQLDGPAGQTCCSDQLDGPAGRTSWTNQLDEPAGRTSWTDQFFLFEALASSHIRRFPFSLYIVAASESDEGLVWLGLCFKNTFYERRHVFVLKTFVNFCRGNLLLTLIKRN